jgi:hypothetical protein
VPLIGVRAFSFSLLKLISVFFFFTDEIEWRLLKTLAHTAFREPRKLQVAVTQCHLSADWHPECFMSSKHLWLTR